MDERSKREIAKSAAKRNDYSSAEAGYRELWEETKDLWDARGLMSALRKLKRYDEAIAVGEEVLAIDPNFDPVIGEFAWAIWNRDCKGKRDGKTVPMPRASVDRILQLRERTSDPYNEFTPFVRTILDASKGELAGNQAGRAIEILKILEPGRLTPTGKIYDGKKLYSDRQRWYLLKGKALLALGEWAGLEQHADQATSDSMMEWINDGDVWLLRWRATAIYELGRNEEAISSMTSVLARKDEWYIRWDLAKFYRESGKQLFAFREAVVAASMKGPFKFKVSLFKLIGTLLIELDQKDLACIFLEATMAIRSEAQWPVDEEVSRMYDRISSKGESTLNVRQAEDKVLLALADLVEQENPPSHGVITKVLPNGRSGFIRDSKSVDRFFGTKDFDFDAALLKEGLEVVFRPTTSFDRKKNRESPAATAIRIPSRG